jgi:ArsR family transcriptional regulator, arsenate/arsenite/antimonite-responsive transcriptional repressor
MAKRPAFHLERFFQALGDTTRLRLLNLMAGAVASDCCGSPQATLDRGQSYGQEICVCYFTEVLAQPQPKISRHLAYLRSAGIVEARREGKWMHYRIVMPPHIGAAQVLHQTLAALREERVMQADLARLNKACCSPKKFPGLEGAPLPTPLGQKEACSS